MARGNQREKAREKNLKAAAGAVSRIHSLFDATCALIKKNRKARTLYVVIRCEVISFGVGSYYEMIWNGTDPRL